MDRPTAELASARSAELKGLLHELQREHSCNRALMQIELGFLDHLMGMLALDGVSGYDTRGSSRRSRSRGPTAACTSSTCAPERHDDPHPPGTADGAQRPAGRAAGARRHGQQHRQREHRRLLARDAPSCRPNTADRHPGALAADRARARSSAPASASKPITRVRNIYLDSQYRTQNSALSGAGDPVRRAPAGPGGAERTVQRGHREPALGILELLEQPRGRARQAKPRRRPSWPPASSSRGSLNQLSAQLADDRRAGGRAVRVADRRNRRSDRTTPTRSPSSTDRSSSPNRPASSPTSMLDRRDLLLDKLSALAQVTVTSSPTEPTRSASATPPSRSSKARPSTGRRRSPPPPAASSARCSASPHREAPSPATRPTWTRVAEQPRHSVNALHTSTPFFTGTTAATIAVAVDACRRSRPPRRGAPGGNDVALAIAGLRGGAAEQGCSALVEQVGGNVAAAQRTNRPTCRRR